MWAILYWADPFSASIASIEGQNWRHGDIEDTLLNILMSRAAGGKKFGKLDVKRVYFGNWVHTAAPFPSLGPAFTDILKASRLQSSR